MGEMPRFQLSLRLAFLLTTLAAAILATIGMHVQVMGVSLRAFWPAVPALLLVLIVGLFGYAVKKVRGD